MRTHVLRIFGSDAAKLKVRKRGPDELRDVFDRCKLSHIRFAHTHNRRTSTRVREENIQEKNELVFHIRTAVLLCAACENYEQRHACETVKNVRYLLGEHLLCVGTAAATTGYNSIFSRDDEAFGSVPNTLATVNTFASGSIRSSVCNRR